MPFCFSIKRQKSAYDVDKIKALLNIYGSRGPDKDRVSR